MPRPGRSLPPGRGAARLWRLLRPPVEGDGLVPEAPRVLLRSVARRFGPDLRPHRAALAVLLLLAIALPAVEAVEIWLFQRVVDDVLVPARVEPLVPLALAYLALAVGSGVLSWLDEYLSTWIDEDFCLALRRRVLAHLYRLSPETVDNSRLGDLLVRLTSDVRAVATFLLAGPDVVTASARLLFFGGAMFLLDWQLAVVSLVVAPVLWWSGSRFARRLRQASRQTRRRSGSLTAMAEESLSTLALVQVHGREQEALDRFHREGRAVLAAELSAARVRATYPLVVDLLELVGLLSVLALGTWALSQDRLTLGELLVFLTYLTQLYRPVRDLGDLGATLVSSSAGAERVLEVLDAAPGVTESKSAQVPARVEGVLTVLGVSYAYPGAAAPALHELSFEFRPGHLVAVTGPSGCGKSTLVRLLARLADPSHGAVLLDGTDVRELAVRTVRDSITVLLQEAPVLDASVRENVLLARPGASDTDVWRALRQAGVADVVAALPGGLDSRLGQRGRSLSGGQRQRIALARALLVDARVLILDEPTTGLDADAAEQLVATLRRLAEQRTVIVATHDAAVWRVADTALDLGAARPRLVTVP